VGEADRETVPASITDPTTSSLRSAGSVRSGHSQSVSPDPNLSDKRDPDNPPQGLQGPDWTPSLNSLQICLLLQQDQGGDTTSQNKYSETLK
ncbi:hypothetical protein GN956_G25806, partial [Arapaima gigas]